MIILSVDRGDVRTGLAVCDKFEMLASPVTVIQETDADSLAAKISVFAKEQKAEAIVVGLPKNMDGTEGESACKCRDLAQKLSECTGLPVELRDERLTTVSAHNALNVTNVRGKKRKAVVDAVAAVMILQEYLDYRKLKGLS